MKGLVDELGLDLNKDGLGDLIDQQPAAEESKDEEEKKDGDGQNKGNNEGGDAAK